MSSGPIFRLRGLHPSDTSRMLVYLIPTSASSALTSLWALM